MRDGVSFVVPVLNGRQRLRQVIRAIVREASGRPYEIIVVDDGSADGSVERVLALRRHMAAPLQLVEGPGTGAAAALNAGIAEARYSLIAQVDQDVVPQRGWLDRLARSIEQDDRVVAAQGRYVVPPAAGFWARMAGRDLDLRYWRLSGHTVDHVCTGNTVYRALALRRIGLFDERLGYGYDNDVSYRLVAAGGVLAFCPDATAEHHWREGFRGYLRQQFGVGYGRLDLVRRHPHRWSGDAVSDALMMAHAPAMLIAIVCAAAAPLRPAAGVASAVILGLLAIERGAAGVRALRLTGDRSALLFPAAHLARDAAWSAAIVTWSMRQVSGGSRPEHSMRRPPPRACARDPGGRALILIPAYNEAANLPLVIADLRARIPGADVLVINDASTDATAALLPRLGVRWLTLADRVGVGGALRAGVRYARRHGYTIVARIDGDGQHRAADLQRVLRMLRHGRADAVTGSRYLNRRRQGARLWQRVLSGALTLATGRRVSDPTSGLWAFGARALPILDHHHPGGYPEPELHLLLARHGLEVREVSVRARHRHAGRTSLTAGRSAVAFARTVLALVLSACGGPIGTRE